MHTSRPVPIRQQMYKQHQPRQTRIHIQRPRDHHCMVLVSLRDCIHLGLSYFAYACIKSLRGKTHQSMDLHRDSRRFTHTTIPSQVIRIVQLNPNIDIKPKFR